MRAGVWPVLWGHRTAALFPLGGDSWPFEGWRDLQVSAGSTDLGPCQYLEARLKHTTQKQELFGQLFELLAVLSYVKIKVTSEDEQQSDLNPGTYQSPHMNRWEPGSARPDLPCWIFSPPGSRDPPGRHWQHRVCDWERPHSGAHLQPRPCGAPEGSGGN